LEGLGGDVRILVTGHDSSIVRKDGVMSSWYVSREEQIEERTEYASLGYA
jgi:hypothetical protein